MNTEKQQGNDFKHALRLNGLTIKSFAAQHGFDYRTTSDVVRGIRRGNYGLGRQIKEKLQQEVVKAGMQ